MSDRLLQIGIHPGLHTEAADYITRPFSQNPRPHEAKPPAPCQAHRFTQPLKTASLFYFPIIRQMVYDSNNPVFELHQFHRHQCETSGIRPVRQLVDVVGFPCQFADGVRILPVQPGYDLCRNNRLPYILTDTQPGFPGSLPDGVILQLGQFRTDQPVAASLSVSLPDVPPACPLYSSWFFTFEWCLKNCDQREKFSLR